MTIFSDNELRLRVIGRLLKDARERANLTQHEVGQALQYSSAQFVSNWERGVSLPPLEVFPRLSELYGLPPKDIMEALDRYHDAVTKRRKKMLAELFREARK